MAFEKAVQSLNVLEEKLRRAFGLAGPIGATLDTVLQPVLIAGDLRDPGHTPFSGRCFSITDTALAAANDVFTYQFSERVLIERIYLEQTGAGAAATCQAYVTVSGEALPTPVGNVAGMWRDKQVAADRPPVSGSGGFVALAGTAPSNTNRLAFWALNVVGGSAGVPKEVSAFIASGGCLAFRCNTAATYMWTIAGRIWP